MKPATVLATLIGLLSAAALHAADSPALLAEQGYGVLRKYCLECHGNDFKYPGLDMRDRETLLRPRDEQEKPFLTPGKPNDSRLWNKLDAGEMPPDDQPQPSAAEKALLKQWIAAGAEFPLEIRPVRAFVGERTLLAILLQDLREQPTARAGTLRYFSLAHLWNNPAVSDEQLRLVRAAVSKLINSLSSQPRIVTPAPVDKDGLVLRIDLADYGWRNSQQWHALLKAYPYGLQISADEASRVYELTHCDLPYVRADWFVFNAARPPLYHQLVTLPESAGIPGKVDVLERLLGVDVLADFDRDRLARAGFSGEKSGISDHNRIVQRHDAKYGYYWPSYDSAGDSQRQNFFRFPLGPKFAGKQNLGAFEHDGGEIIFSLPNKLQAYMLAKSDGTRIDEGPLTIVSDANRFSGSNVVVNGISCMGCHKQGLLPFADTIRPQFEGQAGEIARKVLRLYPPRADMDRLLDRDRKQFLAALDEATGRFLRSGADRRDITQFPEPITSVSKQYDRGLKSADIARELGLPENQADAQANGIKATTGELATVIKFSERLRRLGLTPLSAGESLTRKQWEEAFQPAARELGLGIPLVVD